VSVFKIEDETFEVNEQSLTDDFTISSIPRDYQVVFETCDISDTVNQLLDDKDVLLIDKNVLALMPDKINLDASRILAIEATEPAKTIEGVLSVIDFLHKCKFTKGESLIVVGGGITQDIGSFVGSVYKRGIPWKFVPTTLLAQCDSCIGGKTGINYREAKNQLALFSAPHKIIINTNFLHTLAPQEIKSGLGEIMKVFVMGGQPFLDMYGEMVTGDQVNKFENFKDLIVASLHVKKAIVEKDEFELDSRRSLNYGHTVGHALETMTGYRIPHGQAVAVGMKIVNDMFNLEAEDVDKYISNLISDKEKEELRNIDYNKLGDVLRSDKKTISNAATFIYMDQVGHVKFEKCLINDALLNNIKRTIQEIVDG
jgi:3-dehydroquinate synthase